MTIIYSRGSGPLALALTLLFLFAGTRAGLGLGHCPRHDAEVPGDAAPLHARVPGHAEQPAGDPYIACTCVGACHVVTSTPAPGAPMAPVAVAVPAGRSSISDESHAARLARAPHLLPFANAPPARA